MVVVSAIDIFFDMTNPDQPTFAADLHVSADYGQIYIYSDAAVIEDDEDNLFLDALDDAVDSQRFVGTAGGIIDLMTPGQWNFETPMRVEVWAAEPSADTDNWSHEVDVDLDIPDGQLIFQASGGGTPLPVELPAGRYRARISGAGYTALGHAGADGDDHYRLRLWTRANDTHPKLRKFWPGWENYS
jgi:hypothetical protein